MNLRLNSLASMEQLKYTVVYAIELERLKHATAFPGCGQDSLAEKLFDDSNHSRHANPYVGKQCWAIAYGLSHDLSGVSSRPYALTREVTP
jgi:hypothetical protein